MENHGDRRDCYECGYSLEQHYEARRFSAGLSFGSGFNQSFPMPKNVSKGELPVKALKLVQLIQWCRTRINKVKGELGFCTEAEALAAGWGAPF